MARAGAALRALTALLIVIGTGSLVYYQKITDRGVLSFHSLAYRSDFVFLAAVGSAVAGWALTPPLWRRPRIAKTERLALISVGLYVAACLLATMLALVVYGLWFDLVGFANLAKTLLALALSIMAYVYLKSRPSLYRALVWALIIPPVLTVAFAITLSVLAPSHQGIDWLFHAALGGGCYFLGDAVCGSRIPLLGQGGRFQGLTVNAIQASFGLVTALSLLWPTAILYWCRRRWIHSVAVLVCVECLMAGLLWTEARSAIIASALVLAIGGALMLRAARARPAQMAGVATVTLVLLAGAWGLLPGGTLATMAGRFSAHQAHAQSPGVAASVVGSRTAQSPTAAMVGERSSEESVSSNYGRLTVWRYYAGVAARNILGVGFNYHRRFYALNVYKERVTAHNNILMTWMFGGIVATASLLMLWWLLFGSIIAGLRSEHDVEAFALYLGVAGAFAAMWLISGAFGNLIGESTYAILMAMVLVGPPRHRAHAAGGAAGGRS